MTHAKFLWLGLGVMSIAMTLSACTTTHSQFDCQAKSVALCRRVDEVNALVDKGVLGKDHLARRSSKTVRFRQTVPSSAQPLATHGASLPAPLRLHEEVMRVWLAPYEDKAGNYHADSVIYTVVRKGRWLAQPPKAQESAS